MRLLTKRRTAAWSNRALQRKDGRELTFESEARPSVECVVLTSRKLQLRSSLPSSA